MELEGGGTLNFRQEGSRVRFTAERPKDDRGLYKVWLRGGQGRGVLLGTLIPAGGVLRLDRSLSLYELERAGCWPPEGGEVRLVYSFAGGQNDGWAVISALPESISDGLLRRSVRGGLRGRRSPDGGFLVAAPFRRDRPVALEPLFCLARVEEREGGAWLVWAFDRAGNPVLPASSPASGMKDSN